MKQLLEDYKRRLKTVNSELRRLIDEAEDTNTITRLTIKRGCYQTFIAELERLVPNSDISDTGSEYKMIIDPVKEKEIEDFNKKLLAGDFEPEEEKYPEGF